MQKSDTKFRPGDEPTLSKMRFYSIGIVAANKSLKSNIIEVLPVEELPMLNGYLDDNTDVQTAEGEDSNGDKYSSKVTTGNTIQAQWLRFTDSNRLSSPDVRRGGSVMIYQFGNEDRYWWTTLKDDSKLRKLETVIWGISATPNEGDEMSADTCYYIEFSSHTKTITLHTSQANKEQWGYDIQINADQGYILLKDTNDNFIKLDSQAESLTMKNASGSFVDITKAIATIETSDQINFKTANGTWEASSSLKMTSPDMTLSSPDLKFTD